MTTLSPWIQQFIDHGRYLRGWSPKTVRTYRQSLTALQAADVGPLSRASLQAFVPWMQNRGLTPGGITVRLRTVNAFLTWLLEEGHITERLRVRLLRTFGRWGWNTYKRDTRGSRRSGGSRDVDQSSSRSSATHRGGRVDTLRRGVSSPQRMHCQIG
jgi:hypothetical protein